MAQDGNILLVANWKSNNTLDESRHFAEGFAGFQLNETVRVVVCPPFPYLIAVNEALAKHKVPFAVGVQDVSAYPYGAYTGAVAAEMVSAMADYAIVGHSERRRYFHETDGEVANKVGRCLEAGMTPIVCVDEPYLESQINALEDEQKGKCVYAYEPLTAIGSGKPDTPEHANSVAERIKVMAGKKVPVLYGGSVTAENIGECAEQPMIDGALVGGASLEVESWKELIGSSYGFK